MTNPGQSVSVVRELDDFKGNACLVRRGVEYFVVSTADVPMLGSETLVFPADEEGKVTSWGEVAGGRGVTREEAIAELAER
jgi:hypothetical protein